MVRVSLWRVGNLYLLLAGILSVALLFAPLAFASNFAAHLHATVYGSWVLVEHSLGHGVTAPVHSWLPSLPLHWPYVLLGIGVLVMAMGAIAGTRVVEKAERRIQYCVYLAAGQFLAGLLLRYLAGMHVGDSDLPDALTSGFQREFMLHFFVFYFLWRAWRRRPEAPLQPQASVPV